MVDVWRWSAIVGIVAGLAVFAVLFVPMLVWQSRRFGRLTIGRTVVAGAAAVYGVTILTYTFLPYPDAEWCAVHTSPTPAFTPFHSVDDIAAAVSGLSLGQALRSPAVLQVLMNVVLFVPWGAFSRRLFGRPRWFGVVSGLAMSLFIETAQGTGWFGLAPCVYRMADVDDVLTNTLGAAIGVLAAPVLLWWIPDPHADFERRRTARPVTRVRRLVGMLVDWAAFIATWAALTIAVRGFDRLELARPRYAHGSWMDQVVPGLVAAVALLVLPVLLGSGASLGQRAVWLAPGPGRGARSRALVRLATGIGAYAALVIAETVPGTSEATRSVLTAASWAVLAVSAIGVLVDGRARGISFRVSGTALTDARPPAGGADPEAA
jgi:glycopeptide antibiotics resistance protein